MFYTLTLSLLLVLGGATTSFADENGVKRMPVWQPQRTAKVQLGARDAVRTRQSGVDEIENIRYSNPVHGSFWFANVTIGNGVASCMIDTGAPDFVLNPGVYRPGPQSIDLGKSFNHSYMSIYPNGSGNGWAFGEKFMDTVTLGNLTVHNQTIGNVHETQPADLFPRDCLLGLGRNKFASPKALGVTFFHTLCRQGVLDACRFGLAFKTNGFGAQIMGELDQTLFSGNLTTAPLLLQPFREWWIEADVTLDSDVVAPNATILFDSGTSNIIGPNDQVQKLFTQAGIQQVYYPDLGATLGFYDCANPPKVGLTFPSSEKVFDIVPLAFPLQKNGKGNCTATVTGLPTGGVWVFGQPFFQGKYLDFNKDDQMIGVAMLK